MQNVTDAVVTPVRLNKSLAGNVLICRPKTFIAHEAPEDPPFRGAQYLAYRPNQ